MVTYKCDICSHEQSYKMEQVQFTFSIARDIPSIQNYDVCQECLSNLKTNIDTYSHVVHIYYNNLLKFLKSLRYRNTNV